MNKRIDFSQPDGLGVTQDTLDFMQTSYRTAISALASAFGNKVILSGVVESGPNLTSGWVVIDGELMPFIGGLKADNIIATDATDTEQFGDLSIKTVYYTRSASSVALGGYPYTQFKRVDTVINILTNLTALTTAFTNHTHDWTDITGKPAIPDQKVLRTASFIIGDVVTQDQIINVPFADIGTSAYVVTGGIRSLSSNYSNDNDVIWSWKDPTHTGFKLCLREMNLIAENITFDYSLIKIG